jgi:hypothetical protein
VKRLWNASDAFSAPFALYGAAIEWRTATTAQSPESFADEVIPLIVATLDAVGDKG